jgi:hypothetical protein
MTPTNIVIRDTYIGIVISDTYIGIVISDTYISIVISDTYIAVCETRRVITKSKRVKKKLILYKP